MLTEPIQREVPKKSRPKPTRISNVGLTICIVSALLAVMVATMHGFILTKIIFGMFGVYVFAMLLLGFFIGLSLRFSRSYSVNGGYMICSVVMLTTAMCLVHILNTAGELRNIHHFGEYLEHGFSTVTAGGAVFSIPAYVLWNFFGGVIGSTVVLGTAFLIACAFLTTFIVTRQGENKIIKKKPASAADDKKSKDFSVQSQDMAEKLEQKYQEMLKAQGRERQDEAKSKLGLDKKPAVATPNATYDKAILLDKLEPLGQSAPYQPIYESPIGGGNGNFAPIGGGNVGFGGGNVGQNGAYLGQNGGVNGDYQGDFGGQNGGFGNPVFGESSVTEMSPYKQEEIFTEYEKEESAYKTPITPTPRARVSRTPNVATGQTSFGEVMEQTKKPKPYVKRRYVKPGLDLIRTQSTDLSAFAVDAELKKGILDAKLKEFKKNANVTGYTVAPAITRFEITLGLGTRANDVFNMENDFTLALGAESVRMSIIKGKNAIGVEVPNQTVGAVSVRDIFTSKEWQANRNPLVIAMGKSIDDEIVLGDIESMPHLLIAGTTGSGKSVCINTILTSLVYRTDPADLKFMLIDPKSVEMVNYSDIPHMITPSAIVKVPQAINALKWLLVEMQHRYDLFKEQGVKNISQYHSLPAYQNGEIERMPYLLTVIDEAAALLAEGKREVEEAANKLSALGRASGLHMIFATQRPDAEVITPVIKANMSVRIGFKTVSRGDSTTILGGPGCEKLVGRGDMLYLLEGKVQRLQCAFVDDNEVRAAMNFVRANNVRESNPELEDLILNGPPLPSGTGGYNAGGDGKSGLDEHFIPILRWIVRDGNVKKTVSVSSIQRHFALGFGRASRIVDQMAGMGYVGEENGAKGREVLITKEEVEELYGAEY